MSFLDTLVTLFQSAVDKPPPGAGPDGPPPLPRILDDVGDRITRLTSITTGPSGDGFDTWLREFRSIVGDVALRETLVIRVLQMKLPRVAEALTLIGAIRADWQGWTPPDGVPYAFRIEWDTLEDYLTPATVGQTAFAEFASKIQAIVDLKAAEVLLALLITDPAALVRLEYRRKGFLALPVSEHPGVDLQELLDLLNSPIGSPLPPTGALQSPVVDDGAWGKVVLDAPDAPAGIDITDPASLPDPTRPLDGLAVRVDAAIDGTVQGGVDLLPRWRLEYAGHAAAGGRLLALAVDGATWTVEPGGAAGASFQVTLGRLPADGERDAFLIGNPRGTHFSIGTASVGVRVQTDPSKPLFAWILVADPVSFQVSADILKVVAMGLPIPDALRFASAIEQAYQQGRTLAQAATANGLALEFSKHLGFVVGGTGAGLWVDDMRVRIEATIANGTWAARIMFRFDARAELGPVSATMTGAGLWIGPWTGGAIGAISPDGIGIRLKAGPVDGGGFLKQFGPGRFGGALQIKVLGIGVKAYGLYEEIPSGVSIAAILGIRLPFPGIQLGFGFAVSGIGGLVGINRRVDIDAMRERLQSGSAGDVLFADDPVKNAPKLLGDMNAMLPVAPGSHVFGPTLQLDWSKLLYLDLGLFIEIPAAKFIIAGSARLVIGPPEFALVHLRLDFMGGVDPTASLIFFDGALVNSTVLGIIRISGGIALRLGFGPNAYFLYSVGGFHPAFAPGDMPVPRLARAGASLSLGIVWFKQETYLAITSNTLQFGSRTEAGVEIGPIKVHGWFAFDALIRYRPFWFDARVDAGMDASFEGISFASIRVRGHLTGPGPLVLKAEASVRVIVKISKSVTITIDDNPPESLLAVGNLVDLVLADARNDENVRAEGDDGEVVFGDRPNLGRRLIPRGAVVWEQKRVPIAVPIERAEGRDLDGWHTLQVDVPGFATEPEHDLFARGTFQKLQAADALAASTFLSMPSGFRLASGAMRSSPAVKECPMTLDIIRIPGFERFPGLLAFVSDGLGRMMTERHGASVAHEVPVVGVQRETGWSVADAVSTMGADGSAASAVMAAKQFGASVIAPGAADVALAGVIA